MSIRSDNSSQPLETTAFALLRPVLKLLFGLGLSREALSGLCDRAYVEAGAQALGARDAKVTLKGVAEVSGVSLAKVRRLKRIVDEQAEAPAVSLAEQAPLMAAAERVMSGWYSDAAFTDEEGRPAGLQPTGERFEVLVGRYGNGCEPGEIADFLLSTQSVALNDRGELEPQGRHVLAAPQSEELAHNSLEALVDLARAAEINQHKRLTGSGALQRTCANDRIPRRMAPRFRAMIRETTQSFLESIDDWLVQHEVPDEASDARETVVRLGVGVYVIGEE